MAKVIREYIDLKYDKNVVKESIDKKVPIVLKAILQRADFVNQNHRIYPKAILEREVNNYQKAVAEGRATGECVPAGTEILTENGWKDIVDVRAGESILTLNLQNNEIEIQEVQEKICKPYKDQMVHVWNNKGTIDMTLTKNHKVLLWDRNDKPYDLSAIELYDKIRSGDSKVSHSHIRKSGTWKGESPEYVNVGKHSIKSEDWAAFLGLYIAEGHCAGSKNGEKRNDIGITQNPGDKQDKIKELLNKLPFKFKLMGNNRQFVACDEDLHSHLKTLGNSFEKYIPQYAKNWNVSLLRTMFDWMLLGDGKNRKDRDGNIMNEYCTISSKLAKDVLELTVKLGNGGSISSYQPVDREIEGRKILSENSHRMNIIHESTTEKGAYLRNGFVNAELVDFDDYVYCVSVPPNKTWLMRNSNVGRCVCWTYNCDHPDSSIVSLSNVSHVIREIGWNGNEVVGVVEILNTPKGKIIQNLMEAGVKIGISSRCIGETRKTSEGYDEVDESLLLVAFDLVSEPSTQNAWLHESKQVDVIDIRNLVPKVDRINRVVNEILKGSK